MVMGIYLKILLSCEFFLLLNCNAMEGQLKTEPSSLRSTSVTSSSISDFTERVTTEEEQNIPTTFATGQPAITNTTVIPNESSKPTATLLHHKKTTVGSAVASHGTEKSGKTPLTLYGAVVGGAVVLTMAALTAVCYKTHRSRPRKGSLRVKSDPDSEAFEMKPFHTRNSSPARAISVRRLRSRDSTEDLLDISRREQERGMAMNANENQFFPPLSFQDHHSAHVNPALIGEQGDSPARQTTRTFQDQIRVLIENEIDELVYDSGIEEESSESLRRSPDQQGSSECIPGGTLNSNENNSEGNKDRKTPLAQVGEPFYHVLEGPGDECNSLRHTVDENERVESASIYQPLSISRQNFSKQGILVDNADAEDETILSSSGIYQPLTPSKQVILDDKTKVTSHGGLDKIIDHNNTKAAGSSKAMYQPLLDRHKARSRSNIDRPRSVSGIYHPLTPSPEREERHKRSWTAPQDILLQVLPKTSRSENRQGETDPVYQTVVDEQRCPLNIDDPASVSPRSPRHSPRPSPHEQRRTIHEPTYMAVHVRPSRQNRRPCNSEHEPRYTPPPCRKNRSPVHPSVSNARTGHRRISSDSGRALSAMLNPDNTDTSGPPDNRSSLSVLPRHLGHRRNRSDIGLCPIDQSHEHASRRQTSGSDGGIPRTSSMRSLVTEFQRSASDTTHCRVHIGP